LNLAIVDPASIMSIASTISESIHETEIVKKEAFFIKSGRTCSKIGRLIKGVLRGFVIGSSGEEITTHFFQEGDMIIGSFIPNTNASMNIQALEDSEVSIANFAEVMSHVNKDPRITEIINREFQKLNKGFQTRLVSLLNLTSVEKYQLFLNDYPGLLNRIPHYYIAQYLGITPTQLSRARKQLSQHL